jgi:hypothetical protein
MKRNIDIQKEWESIGAGFSAQIGLPLFDVPANYFNNLSNEIISGINAMSVPDAVLTLPKTTPFEIPQGYLAELHQNILNLVSEADAVINSTEIKNGTKNEVFAVPENYFDSFAATVLDKIKAESSIEEELSDSPLLSSLKGSNPYEAAAMAPIAVPKQSQTTIKSKPEIEVPMTVRRSLRWSNWVAAASVAMFFILGASWLHLDNRTNQNQLTANLQWSSAETKVHKKLAAISDESIEAYLDQHIDDFSEYLLEENAASFTGNKDAVLKSALEDISDDELEAYLYNSVY